mgnify:CR=1 FL=1
MAVIRDVMPAFELFQPTSVDGRAGVAGPARRVGVASGRRAGHVRLAEGSLEADRRGDRPEPGERAARDQRGGRRPRDRRA